MFGISAGELVLILIAGLIIFGPGELPKVGRAIGKGLREFKKAQSALSATLDEVSAEPEKKVESSTGEKVESNSEKVSLEKKSVEVAENISETENKSAEKKVETEKNIPAIENLSAEEKPPHSALTVDDVINLAKQNPLNKENLNEKNFTDTSTTSTATADTNKSNVTAGGNTNSTAK